MSCDLIAFTEKLTRVFNLVNSRFDKVVVTGSAALVFLIQHHPLFSDRAQEHLESIGYSDKSQPNDIDMIIVQNTDFTETKIGDHVSEQSICGSKTFVSDNKSTYYPQINFDLIKMPKCKYIELNGINIIHPMMLLAHYRENYRDTDLYKLRFLQNYEDCFGSIDSEIFEIKKRQSRFKSNFDTYTDTRSDTYTDSVSEIDTNMKICKKLF
jgi:hypothetical protein